MNLPPWLVRLGFRSWNLSLPVILLWPLAVLVALPLALLGGVVALVVEGVSLSAYVSVWAELYRLVCELRGTEVRVEAANERIVVVVY